MEITQKSTTSKLGASLIPAQEEYVSFVAVSGLSVSDDGTFTKMTVDEFASKFGMTRWGVMKWKKTIPDFDKRVDERRQQLMSGNRVSAIWKAMTLKAASGNVEAAKLVLGHFGKWQPPAQKQHITHELGNTWSALAAAKIKPEPIEGEVVDDGNDNAGGVQQAPRPLPPTS